MFEWMVRIMLVDNSPSFSHNLESVLEKSHRPYTIVYKGVDAGEALMRFPALQPDLVIADVYMPGIDGTALVKILKQEYPDCICVLLGKERFNNFSLVQRIVQTHSDDYLPIDMSEEAIDAALIGYQEHIQPRRERLLSALLRGDAPAGGEDLMAEIFPIRCAPVMLCTNALSESQLRQICQRVNQIFPSLHLFVPELKKPAPFTVLVKCVSKSHHGMRSSEERQADIFTLNLASTMLGYTPYLLTLEPDLPTRLNDALRGLEQGVFSSVSFENGRPVRITLPFVKRETDEAFTEKELRAYALPERIGDLMQRMGEIPLCREGMYKQLCAHVRSMAENGFMRDDVDLPDLYRDLDALIARAERLDDAVAALETLIADKKRLPKRSTDDSLLLAEITAFLRGKPNLTLSLRDIAAAFSISKSKLSKLVRQELNDSVMHYYRKIKMEEAQKQLLSGGKIADIASGLGFSDPLYFSRVFKQYTSESPNAYRARLRAKRP